MSLARTPIRTSAELSLIERAEKSLAVSDPRRQGALEMLRAEGLPSRRVEAWHYTDLRALLGRAEVTADEGGASPETYLTPLLPQSVVVDLGSSNPSKIASEGVTVSPLHDALRWDEPVNHLDRSFDTIRAVNAALGAKGAAITFEENAAPTAAVELRPEPSVSGSQSCSSVLLKAGAKAVVVERVPAGAGASLSSAVHSVTLKENTDLLWIIVQERGSGETHLGQLNVDLGADAKFQLFVLNAGGAVVRQEIHAVTTGEGADIKIRGVNLLREGQHIDVTSTLDHNVANTTSTEIFRNVVFGGHGVFQGMIKVAKGAQKTDARLACNTLLLSDDGDFSAKPELEIFADDVQCGHGATAGEINADHLFYLMSRGIPEARARALLIKAFVAEVVEDLEHEAAVEALEARLDDWLATTH